MEQELDYVVIIKAKQLANAQPEKYQYRDDGNEIVFRIVEYKNSSVGVSGVVFRRYIKGSTNGLTPEYQGYQNISFVARVEQQWNKMRGNVYDTRY